MLAEDQFCRIEYKGQTYDSRHGGPFDRGSADSWYSRPFRPHYFEGGTYETERIEAEHMTPEQIVAYTAGYEYNEMHGGKKDWD
jgi:hypothetical protein